MRWLEEQARHIQERHDNLMRENAYMRHMHSIQSQRLEQLMKRETEYNAGLPLTPLAAMAQPTPVLPAGIRHPINHIGQPMVQQPHTGSSDGSLTSNDISPQRSRPVEALQATKASQFICRSQANITMHDINNTGHTNSHSDGDSSDNDSGIRSPKRAKFSIGFLR